MWRVALVRRQHTSAVGRSVDPVARAERLALTVASLRQKVADAHAEAEFAFAAGVAAGRAQMRDEVVADMRHNARRLTSVGGLVETMCARLLWSLAAQVAQRRESRREEGTG